jgi:hypothetical protein
VKREAEENTKSWLLCGSNIVVGLISSNNASELQKQQKVPPHTLK